MSGKSSREAEKVRDKIYKRRRVVNRRWTGVEGRKNICARGGTKSRGNMTSSQYRHRRSWREVKNNGVGRKELLVAGDDEGGGKVHGRMRSVPLAQEPSRSSGGQANAQLHTRKALEAH